MNIPSNIISLLKLSTNTPKQLAQIFAKTITLGLTHTTLAWNCIIRAYAKSPTPIQAILIYNHFMQSSSLPPPDHHTYPALFKACGRMLSLPKGKEIHAHVTKTGFISDIYVQNSLIHMYGVMTQMEDSRRLFDQMPQRDLATWNSILSAYTAKPSLQHEALGLFNAMAFEGVGADSITLVILLSVCTQWGMLDCGRMVHAYALKSGHMDNSLLNLGNALLGFYAKGSHMDSAFQWFSEMGFTDIVSCTILINGYVESGSVDVARKIFDGIVAKDIVLWNSMIHGYVKAKHWNEALELFNKMEMEKVTADEKTVVSVLSACASLSNLQFGRLVHQFILRMNIKIDDFVGTALVDMYAKCGSLEEAVSTFHKLKCRDVFTWTAVITGLANHGHGKDALCLFSQMKKEGIEPNEATFVAILTACRHSGLVNEGRHCFDQMVRVYKIHPKVEHFGCMIDLLSRAGLLCEGGELITSTGAEDRIIACKTLLSACISHAEFGLGRKVAKELLKLDSQSHGVYVLLSNFYALAGCWDDVLEMRRIMKKLNLRKELGVSFVEVKT
ncbi:hypothetical protein AAC387_Pa05g3477 [Persea americana]